MNGQHSCEVSDVLKLLLDSQAAGESSPVLAGDHIYPSKLMLSLCGFIKYVCINSVQVSLSSSKLN